MKPPTKQIGFTYIMRTLPQFDNQLVFLPFNDFMQKISDFVFGLLLPMNMKKKTELLIKFGALD